MEIPLNQQRFTDPKKEAELTWDKGELNQESKGVKLILSISS
jgi:hypothetical protein